MASLPHLMLQRPSRRKRKRKQRRRLVLLATFLVVALLLYYLFRQLHPMRVIRQRHRATEAVQHHRLPAAFGVAYLAKEAAALVSAVVEVGVSFGLPALGQVRAVVWHPIKLLE